MSLRALVLISILAGCSPTKVGIRAMEGRTERAGLEERRLEAGGTSLRYWIGGEGPPLLLLHGFGGDGISTWQRQIRALARERTLIVPDLLWFGGSRASGPPCLDTQAGALLALLDALGIERASAMGVSYGGFVALQMHQRDNDRFDRLVLVDSPGPAFSPADLDAMLARFGAADAADIFIAETPEDVKALIDLCLYNDRWIPRFLLKDLLKVSFSENHAEQRALLADLLTHRDQIDPAALASAPPTLLVWGEHDEVFPVSSGQALADLIGAELRVIPRTAHGPPAEEPREFNRIVLEFLREPAAPGPQTWAAEP